MATQLGNAYLQIVPSAKGMQGTISKDLNGEAGNAGTTAGETIASKIKTAIVGAGIGAALGSTIKSALSEGADLEQSLGGIEALFGDAAEAVKKNGAQAWQTVGVSANDYYEGVTSLSAALIRDLGDQEKAAEVANKAYIAIGDNVNRFGTDMESVTNAFKGLAKGNYTMLDNLNLGFAGSKAGMQDLLKYATELSGVDYSIDSLADMYEAITVVQQELGITGITAEEQAERMEMANREAGASWTELGTTASEGATTLSGSLSALQASWKNLLGNMAIGEDVTAPIQNLSTSISNYLGNLIPMIGNVLTELPGAIANLVGTLAPQLLDTGTQFMQNMAKGVQKSVPVLIQNGLAALTNFSTTLRSKFGSFVDAGLELIKNLVKGIVAAIPTIIEQAPTIISNFAGLINDNAPKVLSAGKEIIVSLWEGIKSAFVAIKNNWRQIIDALLDVWEAINWINLGKDAIKLIGSGIKFLFRTIPEMLKSIGKTAWEWFKNVNWLSVGRTVITTIASGIRALFSNIPNALRSIGSSAMSAFRNISWSSLGSSIISGIVSGISGAAGALFSKLRGLAGEALSAAKKKLEVNSPSKLFAREVGRAIPEGIAYGIDQYSGIALDAVTDLGSELGGVNPNMAINSARPTGELAASTTGGNTINLYSTVTGAEDPEEYGRKLVSAAMLELRAM